MTHEYVREVLDQEAIGGVRFPWLGRAGELREYVAWLFSIERSRWPDDPTPIGRTAKAAAVAALRLWGSSNARFSDALTAQQAQRLVLEVATREHLAPRWEACG